MVHILLLCAPFHSHHGGGAKHSAAVMYCSCMFILPKPNFAFSRSFVSSKVLSTQHNSTQPNDTTHFTKSIVRQQISSIMNLPTSNPVYDEDDASSPDSRSSPGGIIGYLRPPAVFTRSNSVKKSIHDFAENPSNHIGDLRPPFTCKKSWKPKVTLDEDKYKGFGYGEVVLRKTNNGLKVSNGLQLEDSPVKRRKWDYDYL
jgi:hypothetical protein